MRSYPSFTSVASAGALVVLSSLVVVACSTSRAEFDGPTDVPDFRDPDAGSPEAASCEVYSCSRDLKKVLRGCAGSETVIAECGPDEGCGEGRCVDACRSAELSKGSIGCSFWTLPPDDPRESAGACFAAMIANTWDRPVTIKGGLAGAPLDLSESIYTADNEGEETKYTRLDGPLPPGKVAIVFLAQARGIYSGHCPSTVKPAIDEDAIRHGTTITRAFHLETDAPVSAYSIFPYAGARSFVPSSTLLLPTSSWETSYVAVSAATIGANANTPRELRTLQIVANEDDTEVQMRPVADVTGSHDVSAAAKGHPQTWKLSRGQVLQLSQEQNLSGSPVVTNKPIGLFGGAQCSNIPATSPYCELLHQQIAPFSQWGHEYALVPYRPRINSVSPDAREQVPWSLVGAVDGTVLEYEPARPRGAPETLAAGEVGSFMTDELLVVRSQDKAHPFHAAVYMTGSNFLAGASRMGDPEFVIVPPADQFLDRYIFFADYTYPLTTLTVVRRKTPAGFRPVELDCAGEITDFRPVGTKGEYEFAWVTLTDGSIPRTFPGGTCGYGRHEARSEGPFSISVWGTGTDASYGYAGGMGSRPINAAKPPSVN